MRLELLGEIEFLKKLPNFHLIALEANQEIRFKRTVQRVKDEGRVDAVTWEEFMAAEERDTRFGMNVQACIDEADYHIKNEGTKEELFQELDKILKSILPT